MSKKVELELFRLTEAKPHHEQHVLFWDLRGNMRAGVFFESKYHCYFRDDWISGNISHFFANDIAYWAGLPQVSVK